MLGAIAGDATNVLFLKLQQPLCERADTDGKAVGFDGTGFRISDDLGFIEAV